MWRATRGREPPMHIGVACNLHVTRHRRGVIGKSLEDYSPDSDLSGYRRVSTGRPAATVRSVQVVGMSKLVNAVGH